MAEEDTKMETEEEKQETPVAAEEAYVVLNFFSRFARAHVSLKNDVSRRTHTHEYTVWIL